MKNIVIIATMVANEGKAEMLKVELDKLLTPTLNEDGCVSYKIHQDLKNPHKFMAVEEWVNMAAIESHMQSEHIKAYSQITSELDMVELFEYSALNQI